MMERIKSCPCDPPVDEMCVSCGVRYDVRLGQILVPLRADWTVKEIGDDQIILCKR